MTVVLGGLLLAGVPSAASAYPFSRTLSEGKRGRDVRALQARVAGWYSTDNQTTLRLSGRFGHRTKVAVKNFQAHYGLVADGVAGPATFKRLNRLEDPDGSTAHFNYGEFDQNYNSGCSAQANAYTGTFRGGMVSPRRTRRNVRRLMWRLEAVRAKGGANPIGINSGFRSVRYNDCIGGARSSQHMYGTAADNRMARVDNHRQRKIAMRSQLSGVGCYSSQTHNHFDTRVHNRALSSSRFYWWPDVDRYGRHLDESGRPCWGETIRRTASTRTTARAAEIGAGALIPSVAEVEAFERAGEPEDLGGAD